jgi:hypothetical protein
MPPHCCEIIFPERSTDLREFVTEGGVPGLRIGVKGELGEPLQGSLHICATLAHLGGIIGLTKPLVGCGESLERGQLCLIKR